MTATPLASRCDMRTTVTLDPDVETLLRKEVRRRGESLHCTFRNLCCEAQNIHQLLQQTSGNFHAFGLMPGHGKIRWRPKHTPCNSGDRIAEGRLGLLVPGRRCGWTAVPGAIAIGRCAQTVTSENNPSSAGVVRRIARSDHCRCVSTPRCSRTSWKVVSIRQRNTKRPRVAAGSRRVGAKKRCASRSPEGSRTSTQRIGRRHAVVYQIASRNVVTRGSARHTTRPL